METPGEIQNKMLQALLCNLLKSSQRRFLWVPVSQDNLEIFTWKSCSVKNSCPVVLWVIFALAFSETQNHGNQRISQEQGMATKSLRLGNGDTG